MSLDPTRALPTLKPFSLTHILYDPVHPLSIPLTLLSLTPIFLFVSYFTLLVFTRRLTILLLGLGSIGNEVLSLLLKRWLKGDRPYKGILGLGDVGEGYGMPSSHAQAAGFLLAWGVGYALDIETRRAREGRHGGQTSVEARSTQQGIQIIRNIRMAVILFGLGLWSVLVAYSRYHLHYHSTYQIIVGYLVGLLAGSVEYIITEHIPLHYPISTIGRVRSSVEWVWKGIGGVGGWQMGDAQGGWGEGPFLVAEQRDISIREPISKKQS